jgi:hypothetical protein
MGGDMLRYEPVRRSFEVSSAAYKDHQNHQVSSFRPPQEDCNGQMELSSEAVKAGADVVLSKPLKITTVERALDEALGPKWREIASAFSSPSTSSNNSTCSDLSAASAPGPPPSSTSTTMEADYWCQLQTLRGSVSDLTLLNQ